MAIVKATTAGINPPEKTRIQVTNVALANANATVTATQLLNFLLTMTPTAPRTITLPSAADIVAALTHATAADGLEFQVRNFGTTTNTITVVPIGTLSGSAVVNGGAYKNFIIRLDALGAAPTYTLNDMGTSGAGPASGDVIGPASSTDNAVAVFDGVTGKLIKETLAADPLRAVTDASNNVLLGIGTSFAALTSGATNTVLGNDVVPNLTTGDDNLAMGQGAGFVLTTGSSNVLVGRASEVLTAVTSQATAVGEGATGGAKRCCHRTRFRSQRHTRFHCHWRRGGGVCRRQQHCHWGRRLGQRNGTLHCHWCRGCQLDGGQSAISCGSYGDCGQQQCALECGWRRNPGARLLHDPGQDRRGGSRHDAGSGGSVSTTPGGLSRQRKSRCSVETVWFYCRRNGQSHAPDHGVWALGQSRNPCTGDRDHAYERGLLTALRSHCLGVAAAKSAERCPTSRSARTQGACDGSGKLNS